MGEEVLDFLYDFGRAGDVAILDLDFFTFFGGETADDLDGLADIIHGGGGGFVGAHRDRSHWRGKAAV